MFTSRFRLFLSGHDRLDGIRERFTECNGYVFRGGNVGAGVGGRRVIPSDSVHEGFTPALGTGFCVFAKIIGRLYAADRAYLGRLFHETGLDGFDRFGHFIFGFLHRLPA